jgi:hypothetical protein
LKAQAFEPHVPTLAKGKTGYHKEQPLYDGVQARMGLSRPRIVENTQASKTPGQKGHYEPSYPWGRLLALFEVLLTSTLIALFLLAVRRQFRR